MSQPTPTAIKLHRRSQFLEVSFGTQTYELVSEYLRVFSPSAEVKGHGPGQEVLQLGKQDVAMTGIEPQGNYAIKIIFSDGHDSGIYTWGYLQSLGENYRSNWEQYLEKVKQHHETKDLSAVKWIEP